ncbi:MAG: discoidin domain-containing protein [Terracidiphilus sp.]
MHCSSFRAPRISAFILTIALGGQTAAVAAQTVHIDTRAAKAIPFDPDKALGTSIDIISAKDMDAVYSEPIVKAGLSAGWGPISYRQNTELTYDAWHWNPNGTWSDEAHKSGYFTGSPNPGPNPSPASSSDPKDFIRASFGYRITHRGTTRSDSGQNEYSRMTDGDPNTYWKSNPYLTSRFTGEPDAAHPQWVVIDFARALDIDAISIDWANPYATHYTVEYWVGVPDALNKQTAGEWVEFPQGEVTGGKGGSHVQRLADLPVATRFLRIVMIDSSNTCDTHGSGDPRNCVGYAISEISAGNFNSLGEFVDLMQHTPDQAQTATQASSTDPWHTDKDIVDSRVQTGFDLFFTSGYTNNLPAMIPIAMIYTTPEDSANQLAYIEKRGYKVSYVEMSEEPDGAFMLPEDYAEFFIQWARALHKVDSKLKLGGPIFTGENEDIKVWPDAQGRSSWMGRFIDYLNAHGALNDLAFVSFEHYPFEPCEINWSDLYREPRLTKDIVDAWRDDGVPANVPLMITESNLSWALTDPMQDLFSGLWLAESVGSFLTYAGPGAVYYHSPIQPEPLRPGCHAWSTYGNFVADERLTIKQYTAQYFASQIINLDWVKHGAGVHELYPATVDLMDDADHEMITAYAAKQPDGDWSILLVNKDPTNAHEVAVAFDDGAKQLPAEFAGTVKVATFGAAEYVWHSDGAKSYADPDGPIKRSSVQWKNGQKVLLPKASITVVTGKVNGL